MPESWLLHRQVKQARAHTLNLPSSKTSADAVVMPQLHTPHQHKQGAGCPNHTSQVPANAGRFSQVVAACLTSRHHESLGPAFDAITDLM